MIAWEAEPRSKDLMVWNSAWIDLPPLRVAIDKTSIFDIKQMVAMEAVMGLEEASFFDREYH